MNEIRQPVSGNELLAALRKDILHELKTEKELSKKTLEKSGYDQIAISPSIAALDLAILERIDGVVDFAINFYKGSPGLNTTLTERRLTPLHMAALSGHDQAAQKLVDAGANLNAADRMQWTPLHMAALNCDAQMIRYLSSKGAIETNLTRHGGTYQDLLNLAYPQYRDPSETLEVVWKDELGREKPLSRNEFKQITGATFIDENRITLSRLKQEWLTPTTILESFPFTEQFKLRYRNSKSPTHILSKVTHDSRGKALVSSPGLGLFAKQPIKAQAVVGEYRGVYQTEDVHNSYAIGGKIDSKEFRNEIPHINDGFPNVSLIHIGDEHGMPDRDVMFATDQIPEGEQFCWNYGRHPVKYGPYAELRPEETRKFIKTHNIQHLAQLLLVRGTTGNLSFEQLALAEKFRYIAETPSVFFSLILDETLDRAKIEDLRKVISLTESIHPDSKISPESIDKTASECVRIKRDLLRFSPKAAAAYEKYFALLPSRTGIKNVLAIAQQTNEFLSTKLDGLNKMHGKDADVSFLDTPFLNVWETLQRKNDEAIAKYDL